MGKCLTPTRVLAAFAACAVAVKVLLLMRPQQFTTHCPEAPLAVAMVTPPLVPKPPRKELDAPASPLLVLTIATISHKDFVVSWIAHMQRLQGLQHLVATYDPEMKAFCQERSIPVELFDIEPLRTELKSRSIEFTPGGLAKVAGWQLVHSKLSSGTDVLYADVDTAWLRDPRPYFDSHTHADVMVSTDCLSHRYEGGGSSGLHLPVAVWGKEIAARKFAGTWPRCGHTDGDVSGLGFNAGVMLLRSRQATLRFMDSWEDDMLKFEPPKHGHPAEGLHDMTDQESLIKTLSKRVFPIKIDPPGSRAFQAAAGQVKLATLPVLLFSNGHIYFIQRAPQLMDVEPYVVHATFQLAGNAGKKNRMREQHLWLADPPDYYSQGNFIGYEDVVPPELLSTSGMSQLDAHMRLASFYLHITHHLLALARALGRTLIVPRMLCLCDRDEHPDILPQCTTAASDLTLPFICPMDHILDTGAWEWSKVPFRPNSFLESPFVPQEIKSSVTRVQLSFGHKPTTEQHWHTGTEPVGSSGEGRRRVIDYHRLRPRKLDVRAMDKEAVEKLRAQGAGSRVLLLSGISTSVPYCAGDLDPEGPSALHHLQQSLVWSASWCCSDFAKDPGTHRFQPLEPMQSCGP